MKASVFIVLAVIALFLASEMSAFVTCETIYVAGGLPQLTHTPQQ